MDQLKKITANIQSPELLFEYLGRWFSKEKRFAFYISYVYGFLLYAGYFMKGLKNAAGTESVPLKELDNYEITSGRFMIYYLDCITHGNLVAYILLSLMALFFISAVSVILVDLLEIKHKLWISIISLIVMSSVHVNAVILYYYTSADYGIAFFMAVLSIALLFKHRKKHVGKISISISSVLCAALALGTYQAYIGVLAILGITIMLEMCLNKRLSVREIWIEIVNFVLYGLISGILYAVILKILLRVNGLKLSSYGGGDEIGLWNSLSRLPSRICQTYKEFFEFFITGAYYYKHKSMIAADVLLLLLFVCLFIYIIVKRKIWKEPLRLVFALILFVAIPFACNIIEIIATERSVSNFMASGMVIGMAAIIMLCKNWIEDSRLMKNGLQWVVIICTVLIIRSNTLTIAATEMTLEQNYQKTYTLMLKIINRIEENDEFNQLETKKICFAGNLDDVPGNTIYEGTQQTGTFGLFWNGYDAFCDKEIRNFLSFDLGCDYELPNWEEKNKILSSDELKNMGVWPESDSVKMIDNVMVVKLQEAPPDEENNK